MKKGKLLSSSCNITRKVSVTFCVENIFCLMQEDTLHFLFGAVIGALYNLTLDIAGVRRVKKVKELLVESRQLLSSAIV